MIFSDNITGRHLREIRLYYDQSQKQMAQLMGVCRGTYSNWESIYKNKKLPKSICDRLYPIIPILDRKVWEKRAIIMPIVKKTKKPFWKRIFKWLKN